MPANEGPTISARQLEIDQAMERICRAIPEVAAARSAQFVIRENLAHVWDRQFQPMHFIIPFRGDTEKAIVGEFEERLLDSDVEHEDAYDEAISANLLARENGAGR